MFEKLKCTIGRHDWRLGLDGGYIRFAGRINQFTNESETGYTCKNCGEYKYEKETILTREQRRSLKKDGWEANDGKAIKKKRNKKSGR